MTIDEACSKAVSFVNAPEKSILRAFETRKHYVFEIPYKDETYCSPISVNKSTGEVKVYFPLDYQDDIKTAIKTEVPEKYKRQ